VTQGCRRPGNLPAPVPSPRPMVFREVVEFTKAEALEVCGRLAVAHERLARAGDVVIATELAWVFDLVQRRVAP